jgi:CRISPR-associated protein Cas2
MTVVVTRDVADRFRGFLASCMLEIAPGVYTSPRMTAAVRKRVWDVMTEWHTALDEGSVVMTFRDPTHPSGQQVLTLGLPAKELVQHDGIFLVRRGLPAEFRETEGERRAGVGVYPPEVTRPEDPEPELLQPPHPVPLGPVDEPGAPVTPADGSLKKE